MRKINRFLINLGLFICIFLTSFSETKVTTIEALPKREKATLDIEVLKIKTDKITGVIYEKEKRIVFDFKDLKKADQKKKIIRDTNNYDIFILESLDNAGTYMKKNEKFKMNKVLEQGVRLKNGEKIKLKNISYFLTGNTGEKVLEISYETKPEKLYLAVLNNKNGMIENIYKADFIQGKQELKSGKFDTYFSISSNLEDHIIYENEISYENDYYIASLGKITLTKKSSPNGSEKSYPAIGIGTKSEWSYKIEKNKLDNIVVQSPEIKDIYLKLNENKNQKLRVYPYLVKYKGTNERSVTKKINSNIQISDTRAVTLAEYEKITAELKIAIPKEVLTLIKTYGESIETDKVEIPYEKLYNLSLIPSSIGPGNGSFKNINIPGEKDKFGDIVEIPYPKIWLKRNTKPVFEIKSVQDLDFGTVLKGDNKKTATSKIVINNLSGVELSLTPITDSSGKVKLRNGDSEVKAGNFSVSKEQKESGNGDSYFILNGTLLETENSTLEGQHTGQFYLNVSIVDG